MSKYSFYFFILILLNYIYLINTTNTEQDYYRYLQQFGYTPKIEGRRLFSMVDKSTYNEGIKTFQRLYKLPETGQLDEKTKQYMQRSRCGNPDLSSADSVGSPLNVDKPQAIPSAQGRSAKGNAPQNFVTQANVWPKKNLKWFIDTYPKQQQELKSQDQIRRIVQQAFYDWEKFSGLKFEMAKTVNEADLKIKFGSKDHGDGYPFDGKGNTLAHAFYPKSGDVHFDDDEFFTDDYASKDKQFTLRLVAAHEIGHALGLGHSFEESSLMFPLYQQFNSDYNISDDDQQGIQTLYGKPDIKTTTNQLTTTQSTNILPTRPLDVLPINNWCGGEFETGCEGPDGELYLFKGNQVWRYRAKSKRAWDPEPTLISERFPSLQDTVITACVKSTTGYTYLFRNYRLWKLKTHWASEGPYILYGKNYLPNPRVALLHQNSIYLIRNHLIYRVNEFDYDRDLEINRIDSIIYPPPNEHIHAGFTYAKRHYIFTKYQVYVYDSSNGRLLPGYPKPAINGWFACDKTSTVSNYNKKTTSAPNRKYKHREHQHHHDRPPPPPPPPPHKHRHSHHRD